MTEEQPSFSLETLKLTDTLQVCVTVDEPHIVVLETPSEFEVTQRYRETVKIVDFKINTISTNCITLTDAEHPSVKFTISAKEFDELKRVTKIWLKPS